MKLLIALLSFIPLYAQQSGPVSTPQPNCILTFMLPAIGATVPPFNSPAFDNRFVGCTSFSVTVEVPTTTSALSLVVQTAPDNGSGAPGSWSTFTAATGSNPNTLTTGWTATFTTGTSAYFAWLRVQLTSQTGTGQVVGKLFSSIAGGGSGGAGGGCPGTTGTPCVVIGPVAAGFAAASVHPVIVGGVNNGTGNATQISTDTNGGLNLAASAPTPGTITPVGVLMNDLDGSPLFVATQHYGVSSATTLTPDISCTNQALITLTDATLTAVVPVSGTTQVHVCHAHASTSGATETFSIIQGTGVACAGATTTIDAYFGITFATDYRANASPLTTSASNGLCVQQSGAAQTSKIWLTWAQF
jgi:hypothetical protein